MPYEWDALLGFLAPSQRREGPHDQRVVGPDTRVEPLASLKPLQGLLGLAELQVCGADVEVRVGIVCVQVDGLPGLGDGAGIVPAEQ